MASTAHLIDDIYAVADDIRGWERLLAQLAHQFGSTHSHLFLIDAVTGEVVENNYHGWGARSFDAYIEHFQDLDPRLEFAQAHPGKLVSDVDVIEARFFENAEIYNDLLRPVGLRYSMFTLLPIGEGLLAAAALMRPKELGAYGRDEVAQCDRLLPHLSRAIHLRRRLLTLEDHLGDLQCALDRLRVAAAIVGSGGRLITACKQAEGYFVGKFGLRVTDGVLTATHPREADAISAAVAQTMTVAEPSKGEVGPPPPVVRIRRPHRAPLSLVFFPLRPQAAVRQHRVAPRSRVLVVMHDPEAAVTLNHRLVQRLHQLTHTEADIAVRLAFGSSVAEIASARRCSADTVRTHVKRILQKTQTQRQADLVRLLLSNVATQLSLER